MSPCIWCHNNAERDDAGEGIFTSQGRHVVVNRLEWPGETPLGLILRHQQKRHHGNDPDDGAGLPPFARVCPGLREPEDVHRNLHERSRPVHHPAFRWHLLPVLDGREDRRALGAGYHGPMDLQGSCDFVWLIDQPSR